MTTPDTKCDICGRWLLETEDSHLIATHTLCHHCRQHAQKSTLFTRTSTLLRSCITRLLSLIV